MNIIKSSTNKIAGRYRAVIKRNGNTIRETDWFDNLITDNGMNLIGSSASDIGTVCVVGTGTVAPIVNDVALNALLASKSNYTKSVINSGTPLYSTAITNTYVFAQGAVVGNITEVGIGPTTTSLFSRTLITDVNGNPVTLTLMAIDQLTIYYQLTMVPDLTDHTGVLNISGVDYNYTSRIGHANVFMTGLDVFGISPEGFTYITGARGLYGTTALGTILTEPSGSFSGTGDSDAYNATSRVKQTYILNSFYCDTLVKWSLANGNQNMSAFMWWTSTYNAPGFRSNSYFNQMILDRPIPKTNTQILSLMFRVSWGRG